MQTLLQKINTSALELRKHKFYYKGKLFTGVAFEEKHDYVVSVKNIVQGVATGYYQNSFFNVSEGTMRITAAHPDLEGDPEYGEVRRLRGEPFNGIFYEFDGYSNGIKNEFCIEESLHVDGNPEIEVRWYASGGLWQYSYWRDKFLAEFYYFEGGGKAI